MSRVVLILFLYNACIIYSEGFFITTKDIMKFFGFDFGPAKLYNFKNDGGNSGEEYEQVYRNDYPSSINEKLSKYRKERLHLEDTKKHENIDGYSKIAQKLNHQGTMSKLLRLKTLNDEKQDEKDYSKVILLVPEKDSIGDNNPKYFKRYQDVYNEGFTNEPSFF